MSAAVMHVPMHSPVPSPIQRPMRNGNRSRSNSTNATNTNTSTSTRCANTIPVTTHYENSSSSDNKNNSNKRADPVMPALSLDSPTSAFFSVEHSLLQYESARGDEGRKDMIGDNTPRDHEEESSVAMGATTSTSNAAAAAVVVNKPIGCTNIAEPCSAKENENEDANMMDHAAILASIATTATASVTATATADTASASANANAIVADPLTTLDKSSSCAIVPYVHVHVPNLPINMNASSWPSSIPHKGLINLGNTCYLNSAMQMLMSIDGFVEEIISLYRKDLDKDSTCTCTTTTTNCIRTDEQNENEVLVQESETEEKELLPAIQEKKKHPLRDALAQFFLSAVDDKSTNSDNHSSTILPSSASASPPLSSSSWDQIQSVDPSNLKQVIDEMTPLFVGFWQQDAHEFLSTLLDLLHDEIVESKIASASDDGNGNNGVGAVINDGSKECEERQLEKNGNNETIENALDVVAMEVELPESNQQVGEDNPVEEDYVVIEKQDADIVTSNSTEPECSIDECRGSTKKKARVSSSPPTSLSKVASFSELNLHGISALLYGENEVLKTSVMPAMSAPAAMGCKLVGGRIGALAPASVTMRRLDEEDEPTTGAGPLHINENNNNDDTDHAPGETDTEEEESPPSKPLWTDNVVDNTFTMEIRTHLTCDSCNYTRSHEEVYRHLSIEVGPSDDLNSVETSHERTVQEGLRKFFQPEKRELKCEKCFCESATQTAEITKLPRALIVHMKRFIVDVSPDYSSVTYRKNQAAIEFGESLSLNDDDHNGVLGSFLATGVSLPRDRKGIHISEGDRDDLRSIDDTSYDDCFDAMMSVTSDESFVDVAQMQQQYKVRSVVNHIGNSANCGHYTADAHKLYEDEETLALSPSERGWTRFNDSFVSRVEEVEAMGEQAHQTAYMIMYELE